MARCPSDCDDKDESMNSYIMLAGAIAAEVTATTALKAAEGFTRPAPSLLVAAGYVTAFWLLSQVVKNVPLGVAYAVWCAGGIVATALLAMVVYGQKPDLPAVLGMGLIVAGVAVMQLFSSMSGH